MPKSPRTAGAFLASLNTSERSMIVAAQDRARLERQEGRGPNETIELPLNRCEEAIALHRQGKVTPANMAKVLDWAIGHPAETMTLHAIAGELGLLSLHERGDPQELLQRLVRQHEAWRVLHRNSPEEAVKEVTRAILLEGRGLCNPADIRAVVTTFFQA